MSKSKYLKHPKSEQTLKNNNYSYNGLQFVNDMGHPCEYRLVKDGNDTGHRVKYFRGSLLVEYCVVGSAPLAGFENEFSAL